MNILSYSLPLQSYESIQHTIKFMEKEENKHRDKSSSTNYNSLLAREYTRSCGTTSHGRDKQVQFEHESRFLVEKENCRETQININKMDHCFHAVTLDLHIS